MSKVNKKYLLLDNSTNGVNAAVIPANRTAVNYTPTDTTTKGHLAGIDTKLGTLSSSAGDIAETSFSAANNQSAAANVTGLAFANATVRSFEVILSVHINATSSLYEQFKLNGIQRGSDWKMDVSSVGDNSGIVFSITSAGQIQYTSTNVSGFVSNTMKFRAQTTSV